MDTVKLGKKIVISIIIVLLLTIVIPIISTVINGQADTMVTNLFRGLVRFALIGSILYYFYAGNVVAKWLIVIISLASGINGFISSLLVTFRGALTAVDIMNMGIGIICIAVGVILIISSPVNNFLRFQREENKEDNNDNESEI